MGSSTSCSTRPIACSTGFLPEQAHPPAIRRPARRCLQRHDAAGYRRAGERDAEEAGRDFTCSGGGPRSTLLARSSSQEPQSTNALMATCSGWYNNPPAGASLHAHQNRANQTRRLSGAAGVTAERIHGQRSPNQRTQASAASRAAGIRCSWRRIGGAQASTSRRSATRHFDVPPCRRIHPPQSP